MCQVHVLYELGAALEGERRYIGLGGVLCKILCAITLAGHISLKKLDEA